MSAGAWTSVAVGGACRVCARVLVLVSPRVCAPRERVCLRAGARGAAGPGARPRRCAGGCGLSSSLAPRRSLPVASAVTWVMCWSLKELIAPEPVQKQPVVAWGSAGSGGKEGAVSTGAGGRHGVYPHPRDGGGSVRARGSAEASRGARRRGRRKGSRVGKLSSPAFAPRSLPPRSRAPFQRPRVSVPRRGPLVHPPVRKQFGQLTFLPRHERVAGGERWGARGRSVPAPAEAASGSASGRGAGTPVPCPAGPPVPCPAGRASRPAPG